LYSLYSIKPLQYVYGMPHKTLKPNIVSVKEKLVIPQGLEVQYYIGMFAAL